MRSPYRRALAAVALLVAVVSTAAAGGRPQIYAAPAGMPALSPATLDRHYAAAEQGIRGAHATAERAGHADRAAVLAGFLDGGRRFLAFDPRGPGQVVEVIGDLSRAERVAVVVPGADGRIGNFDSWKWAGGGGRALYAQARAQAPGTRVAVVAWLGYDSPSTLSPAVLTDGRAESAAPRLDALVAGLHRINPAAGVVLLCHSYGSVVCAEAAPGMGASDIVLYGSPGVDAERASDLTGSARVWAGRSGGDWTRFVPKVAFLGLGFGPDPAAPGFGARPFDAGDGPHSGYLEPGSRSLRNLTRIVLGQEAPHAR